MTEGRIIDLTLDERTILWRSADIERERQVAVADLLADNRFAPVQVPADGYVGPWRVALAVEDGRLRVDIARTDGSPVGTLLLGLARLRRRIRDYFAICDSYFKAVRQATPHEIETIDMARRGIHNDAAEAVREHLAGKVTVDFDTARRLFTLICVLHIRG